jgi:hypothetical protein
MPVGLLRDTSKSMGDAFLEESNRFQNRGLRKRKLSLEESKAKSDQIRQEHEMKASKIQTRLQTINKMLPNVDDNTFKKLIGEMNELTKEFNYNPAEMENQFSFKALDTEKVSLNREEFQNDLKQLSDWTKKNPNNEKAAMEMYGYFQDKWGVAQQQEGVGSIREQKNEQINQLSEVIADKIATEADVPDATPDAIKSLLLSGASPEDVVNFFVSQGKDKVLTAKESKDLYGSDKWRGYTQEQLKTAGITAESAKGKQPTPEDAYKRITTLTNLRRKVTIGGGFDIYDEILLQNYPEIQKKYAEESDPKATLKAIDDEIDFLRQFAPERRDKIEIDPENPAQIER